MRTTLITVRLTLRTPGGVTAPEATTFTEQRSTQGETRVRNVLPLRTDPTGALNIPGTTIAGSLRHHCARQPSLNGLFGSEPGADQLTASTIQVLGCVLRSQPAPLQRTRTAIDRHRGAPANRTLHTIEQLPAGTQFDVVIRWNDPDPDQLDALTATLHDWAPRIGRGSSVGAGACTVTHLGRADYDLATIDGLMAWLALSDAPNRAYPEPDPLPDRTPPAPLRRLTFAVVDGIHIGTGSPRSESERPEVAAIVRSGPNVIIPGTSIKGVLRARAEYISRTCGIHACGGTQPATCPTERPCPPCRIFGRSADTDGNGSRRAAVAIPDAVVTDPIVEVRQHVAIDRFTGGARDKLLYTDEVLVRGRFTLTLDDLAGPLTPAESALIDATLQDLDEGLVGIGARTTAGYGTVRITDPTWSAPDLGRLAELLRTETKAA